MLEMMHVPVISTEHLPGANAVEDLGVLHAAYGYGYFVWMDIDNDTEWFVKIREWAEDHAPEGWVRFDCDADPVPELPNYNW